MACEIITALGTLRSAIDALPPRRGQRALKVKTELLCLLETADAAPPLRHLDAFAAERSLSRVLSALKRTLVTRPALPSAILAHVRYRVPLADAEKEFGAGRRLLRDVHQLAIEAGHTVGTFASAANLNTNWAAQVAGSREDLRVIIEPPAFEDLLYTVLETYLVPKLRTRFTECYATCHGHTRTVLLDTPQGMRAEVVVTVRRVQPQLRADMRRCWVMPNDDSLAVHLEVARAISPGQEVVADLHSHPFLSYRRMRKHPGWRYSSGDMSSNVKWCEQMRSLGHAPRVGFVVGVAQGKRPSSPSRPHRFGRHTIHTALLGCHVVVAAFRILSNGTYDEGLSLALRSSRPE